MNVKNLHEAADWFSVLQTEKRTQTAVMTLRPGAASGKTAEAHPDSDQVLLVVKGEVAAEVEGERRTLVEGDVIIVPAGTRHRFVNEGSQVCITFNTYSPPTY